MAEIDWDTVTIIDPMKLSPCHLRDAPIGSLFVPAYDKSGDNPQPYLVGLVNRIEVLVKLRGDEPFQVAGRPRWPHETGYSIEDFRIEVDRSNCRRRRDERDMESGEIIRFPGGIGIVGAERAERHLVDIRGTLEEGTQPPLIAFPRWEIVTGTGAGRHVLYHYTGSELLFGPYDPSLDNE